MEHALEYRGVTYAYGGRVVAVRDLTLDVPAGRIVALVGPNGAGKSTLMRLALGMVRPMRGTVTVLGRAPGPETRRRIGYIPEDSGIPRRMEVGAFVDTTLRFYGVRGAERTRRVQAMLDRLGLSELAGRRLGALSVGQRQRAAVAQAIIHEPDLLLLDEPARGLDPAARADLLGLLQGLGRSGKTLLVSSHMLESLETIATDVCVVDRGQLKLSSPIGELAASGGVPRLRIQLRRAPAGALELVRGCPGVAEAGGTDRELTVEPADLDQALEHVPRRLVEAGAVLGRLEVVQPTLQDLYLKLVSSAAPRAEAR